MNNYCQECDDLLEPDVDYFLTCNSCRQAQGLDVPEDISPNATHVWGML